jgi:murein DD-endopeptidase MepM/ murein hydrolase activator NlpD
MKDGKTSVRFARHEGGPFVTKSSHMYAVGRFGKFFVVQEDGNKVTATSVETGAPLTQAFGITPDGKKIVYETDVPTYRVIAEDLETGKVIQVGEKFGADITVVSPVRNEAVALALQDDQGTTRSGVLYVNFDTGEERLLVERDVTGSLTWSPDGGSVFFYQQRKVERPEIDASTGETLGQVETVYAVPMYISLADGAVNEVTTKKQLPRTFARYNRSYGGRELTNTPALARPGDEEGANEHAPTEGETFYSPDGTINVVHDGEGELQRARVISKATGQASTLSAADGAQLLHTMNNGLLVWKSFGSGVALQFIDWSNNATTVVTDEVSGGSSLKGIMPTQISAVTALATGAGNNLPFKSAYVTQVGEGYTTKCEGVSHTGNLAYAYDFARPYREHVLSSAKGKVVFIKKDVTCSRMSNCRAADDPYRAGCTGSDWGNHIIIRSDNGERHLYAHLTSNSIRVSENEEVCQGKYIADQGHTGYVVSSACGDHLHHQLMAANNSPAAITKSIKLDYNDVSSNPLKCKSTYPSGSTETATCSTPGTFSLSASPGTIIVARGATPSYEIYATTVDGFRGTVSLHALNLPGNQVLSGTGFNPQTFRISANNVWYVSTLKIVTNRNTPLGSHTVTVEGRSGNKVSRTSVRIHVVKG